VRNQKRSKERKLNRLADYDYSRSGYYFVTLCTKDKIEYFGKFLKEKIVLSKIGEIAHSHWLSIPAHYENVKIDSFIIMPNHIHCIIIIDNAEVNVGTEQCSVPTNIGQTLISASTPNYGLLSKIIKSFKEAVTKDVRRNTGYRTFSWQRSFYDHVIRNDVALREIRKYIVLNPAKWEIDENNPRNILLGDRMFIRRHETN